MQVLGDLVQVLGDLVRMFCDELSSTQMVGTRTSVWMDLIHCLRLSSVQLSDPQSLVHISRPYDTLPTLPEVKGAEIPDLGIEEMLLGKAVHGKIECVL